MTTCRWFVMLAFFSVLAGCAGGERDVATGPLPSGTGSFAVADANGRAMRVHYHLPAAFRSDGPVVVVMHGVQRNADAYRDSWVPLAERYGALVIAPEFDRGGFPKGWDYNHGGVYRGDDYRGDGGWQPTAGWGFHIVERAFDAARERTGASSPTYILFGHSAGGQFVHRFNTFMTAPRAEWLIAANAGWYTMPTRAAKYPYGLADAPADDTDLARAFAKPLVVLLGEADIDPHDRNLTQTPGAMAQGVHRLARGLAYFATGKAEAARLGVPFNWRLYTVPEAGHSRKPMSAAAATLVFEGRTPEAR